ncbi:MAG: DUF1573 domain-containing protein [Clostridiales bacterium]|nr:DUF1573 domain-containing protein [Clostridiales bacterium]
MDKLSLNEFQKKVDEVLIRHRSVLDILTKLQESSTRVNRGVAKSATYCGCIEIHVKKQQIPSDILYSELKDYMDDHITGELCDICREKIQEEISSNLFYITSLCNLFDINMEKLLSDYNENNLKTLGQYGLL